MGRRLVAISGGLPKPLVKFNEKALIDWSIENFFSFGIKKIVVNVHYKSELIKNHLNKYKGYTILVSEEKELLQTGGALLHAMPLLIGNTSIIHSMLQNDDLSCYIFTANVDVVWKDNNNVLLKLEKKLQELKKQGKTVDILMLFTSRIQKNAISFDILESNEVVMADGLPYMFSGLQVISLKVILLYAAQHNNKKIFSLGEIYIASKAQNGKLNNVYGVLCDDVYHVGTEEEFTFFKNSVALR